MRIINLLFILLLTATTTFAQPIYRLKNILWEYYDTTSFKPYANVSFTYSGNRQGIFSNPDEIERLITSTPTRDSFLRPVVGLQYDTAYYLQFDNIQFHNYISRQTVNNANLPMFYTLYQWNDVHQKYEQIKEYEFSYNGSIVTKTINFYSDSAIYYNNGNGLPDSIMYPQKQQKEIFVYNTAGNIAERIIVTLTDTPTHIYYNYLSSSWLLSIINMRGTDDTAQTNYFSYNVAGDLDGDQERISFAPNFPLLNNTYKFHSYSNHHRTNTEIWLRDSKDPTIWMPDIQVYYRYNSYGFIDTAVLQSFNKYGVPALYTNVRRFSFNYELAWPVTIANQPFTQPTIQLYPNPAGEIITFRISMEDAQPFTASITDMQGRVLMQWKEAATKEYSRTIPTATLPAGMYVLRVDGKETTTRSFVVSK